MPINDTTTNRGYQKPNIANTLSDDVGRLRSALDSIDTDMTSKAPTAGPTFTDVTTIAAGSAGAPSLTFTGATSDTGLYSPGADQVAISTGGSERMRIDSSGRLLLGTSTALGVGSATPADFEIETTGIPLSAVRNSADATGPVIALGKSRGTIDGSLTAVVNGDILGEFRFTGADGTTRSSYGGVIQCRVDGTPGTGDIPGRLVFSTTADGAASPTEQWRISSNGTFIYNQLAPAAVDTTATLTVANLTAKIITSTTAAAVTMTLPTGTDMDAGFSGLYNNMAFEWSVINTGATNAVTVQGGTGHTVVGSGAVAASNSGRFLSRRTAATTWVTYRMSS